MEERKVMDEKEQKAIIKSNRNSKVKKEYLILALIVIIIVLIDQISKIYALNKGETTIISGMLKFNITQNTGAAYGIGSNSTMMYIITNFIILSVIFKFITTQNEFIDNNLKIFLSFIFAGGIANVIDRIFRGYVVEFIDFRELINLPVLNIADIAVIIGWVSVAAIFASFTVKEWRISKDKNIKTEIKDKDKKKD